MSAHLDVLAAELASAAPWSWLSCPGAFFPDVVLVRQDAEQGRGQLVELGQPGLLVVVEVEVDKAHPY